MTTFYSHRKVADRTYIEVAGIEFEDFAEGQIFEHRPGRTFTAEESRLHAIRSLDLSMHRVDAVYNEQVYGGQELISESFLMSVTTALTTKTFGKVVANLGWTNVQFPVPVYAGDTIYAESEILGKRASRSRPQQGLMHVRTRALNQSGKEGCSFERRFLLYRHGQGPYAAAGY